MLRSLEDLQGYRVRAVDGEVGRADDFLFDDERWTVRYAVVDTGGWLEEALTLISPVALREADWEHRELLADLTREQIESSPPIDRDAPVDRRRRVDLHAHYGWPHWWAGVGPLGGIGAPGAYVPGDAAEAVTPGAEAGGSGDPHLRSAKEIIGQGVAGTDEAVGHVEDLIVDDETWDVRYLVVDTRNWLPGRKVLIAPEWVERFDWAEYTAVLRMTRAQIEASPEYDPRAPVNREYEAQLYDFHGRPTYWDE